MNRTVLVSTAQSLFAVGLVAALCLGLTGCFGKQPKQTPFMKSVGGVGITSEELRLRMRDGARIYAGAIESAANAIMEQSDDPTIRRNALMWKARAIPAANQALFQQDPLVALIDAWAFTIQMLHFFDSGAGKDAFGKYQGIPIETCQRLDAALKGIAVAGANEKADVDHVRVEIEKFARNYPIEGWTFNRASVPAHMDAFEKARAAGGLAAAGTLVTDMSDLSARIGLMADEMPRRIMWESELLADTYVTRAEINQALSDMTDIPDSVDNLRLFAEESVTTELLGSLEGEFGSLGGIYAGTLAFVRAERLAITADLQAERAIILETLQAEREIALEAVHEQRTLAMEEFTVLSNGTVEQFGTRVEGVIDHFFLRLAQLLLALILVCGIGGFLILRALKS